MLVYSLSEVDHYTEKMLDFNSDAFTNTLAAGTMAALAVTGIYIGVREYLSARKQHDTYLNNLVEPGA